MVKYTPLPSFLTLVPKVLRQEASEGDLLYYGMEAYRELRIPSKMETKILILPITKHKVQLPDEVSIINLVTYMKEDPSSVDIEALKDCVDSTDTSSTSDSFIYTDYVNDAGIVIGAYGLNYSLFLNSTYYNNNFFPLKYVGMHNAMCPPYGLEKFSRCADTYTISYDKVITTSIETGYILIDYSMELKNEEDDYLIIDIPEVKEYLARAAILKVIETRAYSSDQGSVGMLDREVQKMNHAFTRAKGVLLLMGVNRIAINEITNGGRQQQMLTRLPNNFLASNGY